MYSTVTEMTKKAKKEKLSKESRRTTFGPSQRSESSFADDAALDNAFDATADVQDESMEHSDHDDEMEDDDNSEFSDQNMPPIDIDREYSSAEELSNDESASDEESDDESDDVEDDDSDGESDEIFSDEEEAEGDSWHLDETMFDVDEEANPGAARNIEVDDSNNLEGWTRIETGGQASRGLGLGNMLLDMVQPHQGRQQIANGGFLMDTAENILGQYSVPRLERSQSLLLCSNAIHLCLKNQEI